MAQYMWGSSATCEGSLSEEVDVGDHAHIKVDWAGICAVSVLVSII